VNNILFFSKEGYPHNFQYNKNTKGWEGKIIFDENSDQTFKTQSLHIFESIDSIEFNIDADLVNINYNNNSGLTIAGETKYKNELITNIVKVNESNEFYTKWIYGLDFHKKFPVGTVISFSGVTGSTIYSGTTDFTDDQYFTVLSIKKNAFLISTNTKNDIFDFTYITSGYTSAQNMISINDYNRNLSGETFFENLYTDKKLSIINSNYNSSVVSVKQTGTTNTYLNEIKLNGVIGQVFTLKTRLFTERPKISYGDVMLNDNKMILGKNSYMLAPEIYYTPSGTGLTKKEIIFEDINGNKLYSGSTFIVDSLVTTKYIGTKTLTFKKYRKTTNSNVQQWNTIQYDGFLDIYSGFILSLNGLTGATINQNRDFNIVNVVYDINTNSTIMFTPDYIIEEKHSIYNIIKLIQPHQIDTVYVTPTGTVSEFYNVLVKDAYCYSTSSIFDLSQIYCEGSGTTNSNTIDTFINVNKSAMYQQGIDIYHTIRNNEDYLSIESLYGAKNTYFNVSGYTNGLQITDNFYLTNNGSTKTYNIIVNEKLYSEKTNKSDKLLYKNNIPTQILFNLNSDNDKYGFKLTLNGNDYYTTFSGDTQTTINKFITTYDTIFYNNGFTIISNSANTLNIYSDVDIWQLEVLVNILSTYTISEIIRNNAILLSGNEIRSLSTSLFSVGLSTGMIIKISGSTFSENNKEYNIIGLTDDTICLSYQGVFSDESGVNVNGKSREFLRKPRGEYGKDTYLRVYWDIPYDNIIDESIFIYDVSGDQLVPYNNNDMYKYIGQKPLIDPSNNVVNLNLYPNSDIGKISNPRFQQTIFDEITFKLEQLNSSLNYNWTPEPLEIFLGYNSTVEGVNTRTLKIEKIEKVIDHIEYFSYSGITNSGSSSSIPNFTLNNTTIEYLAPINFSFLNYGFKKDQLIKLYFKDQSKYNQKIFENSNIFKIVDVSRNKITIDSGYSYKYEAYETGYTYSTGFTYFNTTGATFLFKIEVQPIEILYCPLYGQTENEDIRYKVNLNNLGVQSEDDVYQILYLSDIEDNAIDYTLFNRKRKEMLASAREIYDYIGSYKALINSINYFGYNSLQLYEYYKNIQVWNESHQTKTLLHKVLIPDIFDNTVPGWNEIDFIAGIYQNYNNAQNLIWQKTNLFNLSYRITDEEGNNVLIYTLDEVQYKLTKLKTWLRRNVIPISANLVDITGVVDTAHTLYQNYDESNRTIKSVVDRKSTVVNFNYTATLNFDTDYLVTVNFYILSGMTGTPLDNNEVPLSFSAKIKTFYLSGNTSSPTDILTPVQYFKIFKNDLTPFSFNLNKHVDPYIYIETTTYDNSGNGIGYVNNKLFYFDEPRNHWLVNNNFDLTKMVYYQTTDYISNKSQEWIANDLIINQSNVSFSSTETNVDYNRLNNTYMSTIYNNLNNI
jgi:hypothetical protein